MKKMLLALIIVPVYIAVLSAQVTEYSIGQKVYVSVNRLNFRSAPDINSSLLGQLTLSEELIILEKSSEISLVGENENFWYKFRSGSKTGWVFGEFITSEKIPPKTDLIKRINGTYYYYELKTKNNYTRILKITSETYVERYYDSYSGITDEYTGRVVYQANSIILQPEKRKARPSVYIDYPQNKQETEAYRNAYFDWTDDPSYLKVLSRFKPEKKQIKLYVKYNSNGKIYLLENDSEINNTEYGYEK